MKSKTKKEIQSKFSTKHFRIGLIASGQNEDILPYISEAMCELGFIVSVLGSSEKSLIDLAERYEGQLEVLEITPEAEKQLFKQSDVILFLTLPDSKILAKVMKKGIIPIVPFGADITNFDAQTEKGNGFCFSEGNFYELFATIVRAFENYKFTYDWNNLRKAVQKSV